MPNRSKIEIGERYGRLVVTAEAERGRAQANGFRPYRSEVMCDCGSVLVVGEASLRSGNTRSCGCLQKEIVANSEARVTHGHTKGGDLSGVYRSWRAMISRCDQPSSPRFAHYGGRGIRICDRWRDFQNFHADMGDRPKGMSIDRIDNDGNYEPSNCRWATNAEQARNTSQAIHIRVDGQSLTFAQAARAIGADISTLRDYRRRHGIPAQEAVDLFRSRAAQKAVGIRPTPKLRTDAQMVALDGQQVQLSEAIRILGIWSTSIHKRIHRKRETHQQAVDHFAAKRR